jgi:hypothetical protein
MGDIISQAVSLTTQLATSLENKLREGFRKLQRALDILDFLWRR